MSSVEASRTLSDMRRWHTCNVAGDGSSANLENGDDESARKARRQQFLRETQADEAREPRAAGNAPTQGEEMVNVEDNEVYQDTCPEMFIENTRRTEEYIEGVSSATTRYAYAPPACSPRRTATDACPALSLAKLQKYHRSPASTHPL